MSSIEKGYIQIYTGNGKGKTTASIGLTLRALGAGLRVCYLQFIKGTPSSEFNLIRSLPESQFFYKCFGHGRFIIGTPADDDIAIAHKGLLFAQARLDANDYDVLVLDEVFGAIHAKLFTASEVLELLNHKKEGMEIVLTGRNAPEAIIARADLVSSVTEIKHYYTQHVPARKGIED